MMTCEGIGVRLANDLIVENEERFPRSVSQDDGPVPAPLPDWEVIIDAAARAWIAGLARYGSIRADSEVNEWSKGLRENRQLLEAYVALACVRITNGLLGWILTGVGAIPDDADLDPKAMVNAADRALKAAERADPGEASKANFIFQSISSLSDFLEQENAAYHQMLQVYTTLNVKP
ncbi:MAG: hypothetical protein AAB601_03580 [Patescibacteria group bacterium]